MRARNTLLVTMVMAVALLLIFGAGEALAKKDPPLSQTCINFLQSTLSTEGLFGVNFKCYTIAQGTNLDQTVTLCDQFHGGTGCPELSTQEAVTVRQSQLICTPADKTVGGTAGGAFFTACPEFHLKCYNVVPSAPPVNQLVNTQDQFEPETVLVEATQYLCEGATKSIPEQ
jgi:hypothetical protein